MIAKTKLYALKVSFVVREQKIRKIGGNSNNKILFCRKSTSQNGIKIYA